MEPESFGKGCRGRAGSIVGSAPLFELPLVGRDVSRRGKVDHAFVLSREPLAVPGLGFAGVALDPRSMRRDGAFDDAPGLGWG